jgi:hypothetical protein
MPGSRHRRDVARRTVVVGGALAGSLGVGVLALGLTSGNALRLALMLVLLVAVAAGLLAMDETRLVETRLQADLSRERAARSREAQAEAITRAALVARIDALESDLGQLRTMMLQAPRTVVVVAPDRRPAARILEIPDVVPASGAPVGSTLDVPVVVEDRAEDRADARADARADERIVVAGRPASTTLDIDAGDPSVDRDPALDDDVFAIVEVVGEFSLEGLSVFPRPAGMPTFPSVPAGEAAEAEASDSAGSDDTVDGSTVIDLRGRERSPRTA